MASSSSPGIDKFFAIARERYNILLKRRAGLPKPWSDDPIFQREYFCNVFREDDRTTTWFRKNIRDPLRNEPREVLAAIVAFRWFNRIETGEKIKEFLLGEWDSVKVHNRLADVKPVVTGAYIIKTPDGMTKLKGVLWCIDQFLKHFNVVNVAENNLQGACEYLKGFPYLGDFMAYQIVCDSRFTCLLEKAPDIMTWAQPGPGSARGLGRVFYGDPNKFNKGSEKDTREMIALMRALLEYSKDNKQWPNEWPQWELADIQHQLCETDKYCRAEEGGRMKRKYGAA